MQRLHFHKTAITENLQANHLYLFLPRQYSYRNLPVPPRDNTAVRHLDRDTRRHLHIPPAPIHCLRRQLLRPLPPLATACHCAENRIMGTHGDPGHLVG